MTYTVWGMTTEELLAAGCEGTVQMMRDNDPQNAEDVPCGTDGLYFCEVCEELAWRIPQEHMYGL
jgi:hypothetical protein